MWSALETSWQDARYALRGLIRNPAFSLTAIVAGALGIGATTAVFTAVDRILFRGLPYAFEDRLVSVGMMAPLDTNEFLFAEPYSQLRRNLGPFEAVTAFQAGAFAVDLTESNPVRLRALRLENNFLAVFGIRPIAGRAFTPEEDRPNGPSVAMISNGLWRSRFAGDPAALGRTLLLDGAPVQIVGVLPADFEMPTLTGADVVLPLALNEATERSGRAFRVFARLRPGVTVQQALAAYQSGFEAALSTVPPQFRKEIKPRVRPVRDRQVGDVRAASLALFGSVIAVLLIACANIATLLLARAVTRAPELAVRQALGASLARLARQTLTESLVLSSIAGVLGCAFAFAMLRVFTAIAPAALPRLQQAALDARALGFTLTVTIASGLIFGIAPAVRTSSRLGGDWRVTMRSGGLRAALVSAEIAFSMVLLTGAGLLLRSLWALESVPLGIDTTHVVSARFELGRTQYARPEQQLAFFNQLDQLLSAAPGIYSAAITDSLPPSGGQRGRPLAAIEVEGKPRRPEGTGGMVAWRFVTPGYFQTLGIPMARGRAFTETDRAPSAYSIIVSQSLAKLLFPNEDPIGKRILKGPRGEWMTVIAVARDVTNLGVSRESWPEYYVVRKHVSDFNFENAEPPTGWRAGSIIARTSADPKLAAGFLRSLFASIDPSLPIEIQTMNDRLHEIDQRPRFYAILLATFASMGVLIASAGLFGVMSFLVAQRQREFGVRMALGATPSGILRLTLGSAARWTIGGLVLGAAGSYAAARVLRSLLFHVPAHDPATWSVAIAVMFAVAMLAAILPARRAARLDPVTALRDE